jgi:PAS domain S-box-containing protein
MDRKTIMKNFLHMPRTARSDEFGRQKAGLLWYIIGMVVILTIFRVMVELVVRLKLFTEIDSYQHHIQWVSTFLLFLVLGLLWMAYRQWHDIIHERHQLETILASIAPDMILATDSNDRIVRCGGAVEKMTGYKPEELIGEKTDLLYNDRRVDGQSYEIQSSIHRAGFHVGYATGCTKDHGDYLLEIQTSRLRSVNGGAVMILRNLDERQQARAQMQRRIRMEETFAGISSEFLQADAEKFGETCRNTLHQLTVLFGYEAATVGFFETAVDSPHDVWTWQDSQDPVDPSLERCLARAAATVKDKTLTTYTLPDSSVTTPPEIAELYSEWKIRSIAISPIWLKSMHFGFLILFSKEHRRQKSVEEDATWLQAIASTFLSGRLLLNADIPTEPEPEIPAPPAAEA